MRSGTISASAKSSSRSCRGGTRSGARRCSACSRQLIEQRLRLLQIGGVETLGEQAIDRRQQGTRLGPPALLAPQPGKARRGAQLIGLCLLPARYAQCLFEGVLAFLEPIETDKRDALETAKVRLPLAVSR